MSDNKKAFPLLKKNIDGNPIVYLDSASTTPKPQVVIDAVNRYYTDYCANIHRGVHILSREATDAHEQARYAVAALIGAEPSEIIFTRNTTESINLVAYCLGLTKEDEVIIPASEHHSNFLPWVLNASPVVIDLDEYGVAHWGQLAQHINKKTKLISMGHVSNVTGVIAPVEEWTHVAHSHGVPILIDAAQSISHLPINVKDIGCDFMAFSSHKLFGPSGVGVLYVKKEQLAKLKLFNVGGGMVLTSEEKTFTPKEPPFSYEAGTPNIEGAIGLSAAIHFVTSTGMNNIAQHSQSLGKFCLKEIGALPNVKIMGGNVDPKNRIGICAFALPESSMSHNQLAQLLSDSHGIIISAGTHCAHVLHRKVGLASTLRVSVQIFNSEDDIEKLVRIIKKMTS